MTKEDSLIFAFILDGNGGGRRIKWDEIKTWEPSQGILWVHLNYKVPRTAKWLLNGSGLDKLIAKAMAIEESRPRSLITPNGLLVFLRGVNLNPGEDPEDMVSIRVWIDHNKIITTRHRKLLSVQDIATAIDQGIGPKTPAEFVTTLNNRLLERMADVIDNVSEAVDDLEENILEAESRLLRPKISEIRRQSIVIRRYLAPQREALSRLYYDKSPFLSDADRMYIREDSDRVIRYIEELDATRERAGIAQEELTSRISEQMDHRMYVLSVVAVIFLPLSFLTGLLGINVGGIPGADYRWGFVSVCVILVAISALMLGSLRRKHWL